jgi:hypothetical protein
VADNRALGLIDDVREWIARTSQSMEGVKTDAVQLLLKELAREIRERDEQITSLKKSIEDKSLEDNLHAERVKSYDENTLALVRFLDDKPWLYPSPAQWHHDMEEHLRKLRNGIGA